MQKHISGSQEFKKAKEALETPIINFPGGDVLQNEKERTYWQ
jgi:hypothetical protein